MKEERRRKVKKTTLQKKEEEYKSIPAEKVIEFINSFFESKDSKGKTK